MVFPASLGAPVMEFLQEEEGEPNAIQRIINQLVEVQQVREGVYDKSHIYQDKMKIIFVKKVKGDDFQVGDLVLGWDARFEDKGKHGKFDHLWKGPYKIVAYHGNNSFILRDTNGDLIGRG